MDDLLSIAVFSVRVPLTFVPVAIFTGVYTALGSIGESTVRQGDDVDEGSMPSPKDCLRP